MKNVKIYKTIRFQLLFISICLFIFLITVLIISSNKLYSSSDGYLKSIISKNIIILKNYFSNNLDDINLLDEDLLLKYFSKLFKKDKYLHHIIIYNTFGKPIFIYETLNKLIIYSKLHKFYLKLFTGLKYNPPIVLNKKDMVNYAFKTNIYLNYKNLILKIDKIENKNNKVMGYIQFGYSKNQIYDFVYNSISFLIFIGIIMTIIAFAVLYYIRKNVFHPVQKLIDNVKNVKENELPELIEYKNNNEIGLLISSFNNMIIDLKDRIKDMQTIQKLGMELSTQLRKEDLFNKIIKIFTESSLCKKCAVLLVDDENKDELNLAYGLGLIRAEFKIKFGEGISGNVALSMNYKIITNIIEYPDYLIFYSSEDKIIDKNILAVPMVVKDKLIGVILLTEKQNNEKFNPKEILLYQTLASSAAISLENAKLYELAITDGLTKAYIHRYFQLKLDEEINYSIETNEKLCLIMLDIDHFKKFNDTYGHQQGDIVLIHLVRILNKSVRIIDVKNADRRSDTVARYGGEEFVIILPNTDLEGGIIVAERVRKNVEAYEFPGQTNPLRVTISMGISEYNKNINKADFIKQSDEALYKAKSNGRNRVEFYVKKGE